MHQPHFLVSVTCHILGNIVVRDGRNTLTAIDLILYRTSAGGLLILHLLRVHPVIDSI